MYTTTKAFFFRYAGYSTKRSSWTSSRKCPVSRTTHRTSTPCSIMLPIWCWTPTRTAQTCTPTLLMSTSVRRWVHYWSFQTTRNNIIHHSKAAHHVQNCSYCLFGAILVFSQLPKQWIHVWIHAWRFPIFFYQFTPDFFTFQSHCLIFSLFHLGCCSWVSVSCSSNLILLAVGDDAWNKLTHVIRQSM